MFGSNNAAFGQSSSSPFGGSAGFVQANSPNNNPFAPKPFGSSSPFGSQSGGSIFGGTSTGVFGTTQSSTPLVSTPAFGTPSMPSFGNSAFGSPAATPAFGSGSSTFGGSSAFGQKPGFSGFGSSTPQANTFGSNFQQSQSAFGSNTFGSSPFGASSQPPFGSTSSPAFGTSSTPAFGAPTAFGAPSTTPAFNTPAAPSFGGANAPSFGSAPAPGFGTSSAFGSSGTSPFGSTGATTAFGAPGATGFPTSPAPAFGTGGSPAFGSSNFGASNNPISFGSSPAFGQSVSTITSSPFGTNPAPFGAQSSPFGSQTAFGSGGFGQSTVASQTTGSRVVPYSSTVETEAGTGSQSGGKLESISAMNAYKDKSHEELRFEDYQKGDKGGPSTVAAGTAFGALPQSSPFATSTTFGQTSVGPFSATSNPNPFAAKPIGSTGFGTSSSAFGSAFGNPPSTPFSSATPSTPSLFPTNSNSSTSIFGSTSGPAFGAPTSPSVFASPSAPASNGAFAPNLNFGNSQSGFMQSPAPSIAPTSSAFGTSMPSFGQSTTAFAQPNSNIFATNTSNSFGGGLFANNPSPSPFNPGNPTPFGQATPSLSTPFPAPQQAPGSLGFGNLNQTSPASNNFGNTPNMFAQSIFAQPPPSQNNVVAQSIPPVTNPFGTLPPMPQLSIGRSGPATSDIQYGISSMPVSDRPSPSRVSSLVTTRNFPSRRIRLFPRTYHPKLNGQKVPFFSDDEGPSTPKADASLIPRENPRDLFIRPIDQWRSRISSERKLYHEDGSKVGEDVTKEPLAKCNGRSNGVHDEEGHKGDSFVRISGQRAGEAAIAYEHGADIEAIMPKLRSVDYYTEPRIQELAAKERAEPGYCRHVKDFVVGRHGYGSIKFIGETDVRGIDIESIVQLNNKEVVVYMDEAKKPPVGQGLNKPAEVTLCNIKCINRKTGEQFVDGAMVEKYKVMLMKKAQEQSAEFLSFDPVKGEWKFKVDHF